MKLRVLSRILQSLAVICWGVVLTYFYVSDRLVKYLAPDFRLIAFAGGLALVVIGLFTLLTAGQHASCGHDHGPGDEHDHEALDIHPIAAFLILIAPLFCGVAWTKDQYSIEALTRKGLDDTAADAGSLFLSSVLPPLTKELIEKQHPPDENGYRPFPVMELFFTSADPEMRALVEGMPVVTEGRMVASPDGEPGSYKVYRLFITCCAADSRPIPITAQFEPDALPQVEKNAWMKLSGTITFPDKGRGPQPVLEVDFAVEGQAPLEESYMRGGF
ncbi:DUF1980 domain-containing protein [Haloferula sp. A504]|uniref:TIGR03943 family putative permease subunit n=1 Tax=Haloferula sp. A504 TaxID=3373601 RepID=UPI0031BDFD6A|nr:DUF1980 domain-containing protein [Verrucomicrobiaceae bacterium E54]